MPKFPTLSSTALVLAMALTGPVQAFDYVVTRYDDPFPEQCLVDDCSLREAVMASNANAGSVQMDRIFLSAGTYLLTREPDEILAQGGDLDVVDDLEILGPGATMTKIQVVNERVFNVQRLSSSDSFPTLLVRGMKLVGGGSADGRIARANDGNLILEEIEVGTIGVVPIVDGPDSILATGTAVVAIRNSTFGAQTGAAVRAAGAGAAVVIENSTISRFKARALEANSDASILCTHCTLFNPGSPGIAVFASFDATVTFANSIVEVESCASTTGGAILSLGGNLEVPNDTCGFDQPSDLPGSAVSGLLAPTNNGGSTNTHSLAAESFAVGAGLGANCLGKDQRGATRSHPSFNCDSGAFERVNKNPPTPLFSDGFDQGSLLAWSSFVFGS